MSVEPHLFVILGTSGDLANRKLLPALGELARRGELPEEWALLGVARRPWDDEKFQEFVSSTAPGLRDRPLAYHSLPQPDYPALATQIVAMERKWHLPGNRLFYLALPPQAVPQAVQGLGEAGLAQGPGWTRVVVEKPFGHDLASAKALNSLLARYFREDQLFRIDHYLGKETVQNLLIFRFANPIFEELSNRRNVECVQITVAEEEEVGSRGEYYDRTGALRDMVQNHLTQLLTLVAMEVPPSFSAAAIRDEKVKVLQAVRPLNQQDVIRGQYVGYRQEPGVAADSDTETYVALRVWIDNWRWQGVPFYLRTGKRLPRKTSQIAIRFRHPPVCLFRGEGSCSVHCNVLYLMLQPVEGFALSFDVKVPGEQLELLTQELDFYYREAFGPLPEAYQALLLEVMEGEGTLFVRSDEVEAAWSLYEPILDPPLPLIPIPPGAGGPPRRTSFFWRIGGWCMTEIEVFPDLYTTSLAVAQEVVSIIKSGREGKFGLALSGGRTPRLAYELLGTRFAGEVSWERVHLFFTDERCVPPTHPHSNYRLAWEHLLCRIPLPNENLHRIRGELPPPEAARLYAEELGNFGPLHLILLGGEDGHTASLFPRDPALEAKGLVATVPQPRGVPPLPRVTLTLRAINAAQQAFILVAGEGKRGVVERALAGEAELPVAQVAPRGRLKWFLTQDAAPAPSGV